MTKLRTGLVLGRLELVRKDPHDPRKWLVRCECQPVGVVRSVLANNLAAGRTLSCGCLRKEKSGERATRHGRTKHPLYRLWISLRRRRLLAPEWLEDLEAFASAVGGRPSHAHRLERVDTALPYQPGNVRWVSTVPVREPWPKLDPSVPPTRYTTVHYDPTAWARDEPEDGRGQAALPFAPTPPIPPDDQDSRRPRRPEHPSPG